MLPLFFDTIDSLNWCQLQFTRKMTEPDFCPTRHDRDGLLEDLPPSISRYQYQGKHHFRRTLVLEVDRLERSLESDRLQHSLESGCLQHADESDHVQHSLESDHLLHSQSDRLPRSTRDLQEKREATPAPEERTEYILFYIDSVDLEHDFLDPDTSYFPRTHCSYFDTTNGLLLVKMPSQEHTTATSVLGHIIENHVESMGLWGALKPISGSRCRANGKGKESDWGLGPRMPLRGQAGKPTVVLEVAISECQTKLKRDVDFWLNPSEGHANIALTLKANRKEPIITINKWEWVDERSHRTQHITIAKDSRKGVTKVSGSPMIIPFDLLFRRPKSSAAEKDVEITEGELQDLAERIWEDQGF